MERKGKPAGGAQKKPMTRLRKALLFCCIASSLWYVGMNIHVPGKFPLYHSASQVISELPAVSEPSKSLRVLLSIPYNTVAVLLVFGAGAFMDTPGITANRPAPYSGIWERTNIGVLLLWIALLTIYLWQRRSQALSTTAGISILSFFSTTKETS